MLPTVWLAQGAIERHTSVDHAVETSGALNSDHPATGHPKDI
jgi:hypothetical protein